MFTHHHPHVIRGHQQFRCPCIAQALYHCLRRRNVGIRQETQQVIVMLNTVVHQLVVKSEIQAFGELDTGIKDNFPFSFEIATWVVIRQLSLAKCEPKVLCNALEVIRLQAGIT